MATFTSIPIDINKYIKNLLSLKVRPIMQLNKYSTNHEMQQLQKIEIIIFNYCSTLLLAII